MADILLTSAGSSLTMSVDGATVSLESSPATEITLQSGSRNEVTISGMLQSVYDPQTIEDDAFDLGVHTGAIDGGLL